jgi:hypothetical protein
MIRISPPFYLLVAAAMLLAGSACRDASKPTTPNVQPETPELQWLAQESSPDPMAVARAVPGFGGLFLLVLAVPGTVFTDLDERSNRVRIGVEDGTAEVSVKQVIARLGIPATALIVERTAPIRLAATLRSRMRPVRGSRSTSPNSSAPWGSTR